MASTGVSWIPLFELLESRGFQVLLVDPRQVPRAPGRPKSDAHAGQWRPRLHTDGLLAGACRPEAQVCVLRGDLRPRQMLITSAGQHIQHRQKALARLNSKLTEVGSDITGGTGMSLIQAILPGDRDPLALAKLRDRRGPQAEATIASALHGHGRPAHRLALQPAVAR